MYNNKIQFYREDSNPLNSEEAEPFYTGKSFDAALRHFWGGMHPDNQNDGFSFEPLTIHHSNEIYGYIVSLVDES